MTREEFDRQTWRKNMRCFIEIEVAGKKKKSFGTIIKVHFGGQFLGVKFDGKDYVERVNCERVTLFDKWQREEVRKAQMRQDARQISDQIRVCIDNYTPLNLLLTQGLIQATKVEGGEMSIDLHDGTTIHNEGWLIRQRDGHLCGCNSTYHKEMEDAGLIRGTDFGFNIQR